MLMRRGGAEINESNPEHDGKGSAKCKCFPRHRSATAVIALSALRRERTIFIEHFLRLRLWRIIRQCYRHKLSGLRVCLRRIV